MNTNLIYHYTSLAGFLGIIGSKHIRASNYNYLNDSNELLHGFDKLREAIKDENIKKENSHEIKIISKYLESAFSTLDLYSCSFSQKGDLLSQWRAYSDNDGISIGFDRSIIENIDWNTLNGPDDLGLCVAVEDCIYYQSNHKELLSEIINDLVENEKRISTKTIPLTNESIPILKDKWINLKNGAEYMRKGARSIEDTAESYAKYLLFKTASRIKNQTFLKNPKLDIYQFAHEILPLILLIFI